MDCPGIEMAEIQKEKDIHVRGVCPFLLYRKVLKSENIGYNE